MGLIGNVLQPIYSGSHCVLMSPAHFLQRPLRWLQAISRYKATTSGGPNFAYDLCVRKISAEQASQLDLRTWTVAFNGAEPIRPGTLQRFASHFESGGFRAEAFRPCYGLAEATLLVSMAGGPRMIDDGNARSLVSSGETILDQKIVIVDPESLTECATGETGEIWVSSKSVAQGYWNQAEETERVFRARLADSGYGPFLRTEDLGLMAEGELYVTGRLKDLVIIRGRNHYPQDIEQTVEESHSALRPGCGVAFSIDSGDEERLVVVQELDRNRESDAEAAIGAIRDAVAERHELQVYAVVLIGAGTLSKTTSGKVQRRACKQLFVEDRLHVRARSVLGTSSVISLIAGLGGIDPAEIDLHQPLTNYGLDSLTSIQLQNEIESRTGRRIPLSTLFGGVTIADLAVELSRADGQGTALEGSVEPGEYGLSYGQRAIWFLHRMDPESTVYNIARAIEIFEEIDVDALRRSLQSLVDRHPVLRTTFREAGDEVLQQVNERAEVAFAYEPAEEDLTERLAREAQRPFDLQQGPLLRIFVFRRAARDSVMLFVVHHIVADLCSLALLFDELWQIYLKGETVTRTSAMPFSSYVSSQQDLLGSADFVFRRVRPAKGRKKVLVHID
jgi:acyl carrier protein